MPVRKRSRARRLALQALCAFEALGDAFAEQLEEFLRDRGPEAETLDPELSPEYLAFARDLAREAWADHARCDEIVQRHLERWTLDRVSPVERNILRLGTHELLAHAETAPQIVINEAVELAHLFGDKESPAFVNGVLDAVHREVQNLSARPDQRAGAALPEQPAKDDDGAA